MKCPRCASTSYRKNGRRNSKQNYLCKNCGRQFLETSLIHDLTCTVIDKTQLQTEDLSSNIDESNRTVLSEIDFSSESEKILQVLLSESAFQTKEFDLANPTFLKPVSNTEKDTGVAILLLDAENLKLDINAETFLSGHCQYPLQGKIAFANWKNPSIGKRDSKLYERGYQLIHVPEGKDGADAKMIALGASIRRYYPTAKEVFVCSSDRLLNHLCNELQSQGLTVYWVKRQIDNLFVENRNTGETTSYSLDLTPETPSFARMTQRLEYLSSAERESIAEGLKKLVRVANLFQERYNIPFNPSDLPALLNEEEITQSLGLDQSIFTNAVKPIKSKEELEEILIEMIQQMQHTYPHIRLSVAKLGAEFRKQRGLSANSIIKKLKLGASFTHFLESSPTFNLMKNGNGFEVRVS